MSLRKEWASAPPTKPRKALVEISGRNQRGRPRQIPLAIDHEKEQNKAIIRRIRFGWKANRAPRWTRKKASHVKRPNAHGDLKMRTGND